MHVYTYIFVLWETYIHKYILKSSIIKEKKSSMMLILFMNMLLYLNSVEAMKVSLSLSCTQQLDS